MYVMNADDGSDVTRLTGTEKMVQNLAGHPMIRGLHL